MNWIFKIAPSRLKDFDNRLRQKYPWLWATRIHLTLYLALVLAAFSAIIGFITPMDIQNPFSDDDIMEFYLIFMIPAVILIGHNVFQLCLYSVEKRKGLNKFYRPWIVFPLMMISMASPLVMPYTTAFVLNWKVGNLEDSDQFKKDFVDVVKSRYYVNGGEDEYDYIPSEEDYQLYKNPNVPRKANIGYGYNLTNIYWHKKIFKESRPRLQKVLENSRFYSFSNWYLDDEERMEIKNINESFYYDQNRNFSLDSAKYYLDNLNFNIVKYSGQGGIPVDQMMNELSNNTYSNCYSNKDLVNPHKNYRSYSSHPVVTIHSQLMSKMSRIMRAQSSIIPKDAAYALIFFGYAAFGVTLLIFIFRHVHWKQFLLTILILGIFCTIMGIIEVVGRFRGDFFPTMSVLLLLASIIVIHFVWTLDKFSVFVNQMTIIALIFSPFYLVIFTSYLDAVHNFFRWDLFDHPLIDGDYSYGYSSNYYAMKSDFYWKMHWLGIGVFYVLGLPYLKKVAIRLMSLPKNS